MSPCGIGRYGDMMRSKGFPAELERRRILGIRRMLEGYSVSDVAEFFDVEPRTVKRWWSRFRGHGWEGMIAQTGAGRRPKLSSTQEKIILRWLRGSPQEHGFSTELWTAARIAHVIREEWQIEFNPRYLSSWLRLRGFTPQRPQRIPRERDPDAIARWLAQDWPRIKKKRVAKRPASFSSTKAGF